MYLTRFYKYIQRNPFLIIGILVILFLTRANMFHKPSKPIVHPLPRVAVKEMDAHSVVTTIQLNGHSAPARSVTLKAKTEGRILSLLIPKGQKVDAGQDLILIDPENRPARLAEAQAKVLQRSMELKADTKLEAKAVKSHNALAASHADYECAKSALSAIEQEIADTHVKAPFDGIFEDTFVETGDVVKAGDQIATIIELNPLYIICDISEKDIARIKLGTPAQVVFTSLEGQKREARVTYIAKASAPKTRTYRVEMEADNPDMTIPAGVTTRINFPVGKTNGYLISPATISLKDDGTIGVKTVKEGKVLFHPIQIVETKPEGLLVTGLPNHITLITAGGDFVLEGQKVQTSKESLQKSHDTPDTSS